MRPDTPADPAELRAEIEQTRDELGATVEALAAKADVKARAKEAGHDAVVDARARIHAVGKQVAVIGRRLLVVFGRRRRS